MGSKTSPANKRCRKTRIFKIVGEVSLKNSPYPKVTHPNYRLLVSLNTFHQFSEKQQHNNNFQFIEKNYRNTIGLMFTHIGLFHFILL